MRQTEWSYEFQEDILSSNGVGYFRIFGPKEFLCSVEEPTIEESERIAKTMVAAPELLKAAIQFHKWLQEFDEHLYHYLLKENMCSELRDLIAAIKMVNPDYSDTPRLNLQSVVKK